MTVSVCIYFIMVIAEYLKELISSKSCYKLNIVFKDFTLENITSYYDSGFKIKDIISNKDVMIISFEKVKKYMPLNLQKSAENFLNGNYKEIDYKFVPIMFRTLSGSGIIPAIKSKYIVSDKKKIENILVAFTSDNFTENITAIFGNDIKKQL